MPTRPPPFPKSRPQSVRFLLLGLLASLPAKVEAEMFQADLDYRQALSKLKALMGER